MGRIRVVIVDDQKLFAGSMKIVLEEYGNNEIEVCGIAYDGREAISLVESIGPDLVLMDVRMPVMDGVEATRVIHEAHPYIKIMILTTFDDDEYVYDALSYGAAGYVLKEIQPEELVAAVKAIAMGSHLISPSVSAKLLSRVPHPPRTGGGKVVPDQSADRNDIGGEIEIPVPNRWSDRAEVNRLLDIFPSLGRREAEVLNLMMRSYDNHEIAARLFIAEQTVKNYTSIIYDKLGVADRLHAIRLAGSKLKTGT